MCVCSIAHYWVMFSLFHVHTSVSHIDICVWDCSKDWTIYQGSRSMHLPTQKHYMLISGQLIWTDCITWAPFPVWLWVGSASEKHWQEIREQEENQGREYFPDSLPASASQVLKWSAFCKTTAPLSYHWSLAAQFFPLVSFRLLLDSGYLNILFRFS